MNRRPEEGNPALFTGPGGTLDLINLFSYHAPSQDQIPRFEEIRAKGLEFATLLAASVPSCPERSTALAKIREAVMWANAGIACNEAPAQDSWPSHDR